MAWGLVATGDRRMKVLVDRPRHTEWKLWKYEDGYADDQVIQAILMDIREHLKTLVGIFQCSNALEIPQILREISAHTKQKKRTKKRGA